MSAPPPPTSEAPKNLHNPQPNGPAEGALAYAADLDAGDELATLRDLFHVPPTASGPYGEVAYLAGCSLGLQPKATRALVDSELDSWARLGVDAHREAIRPWFSYHELLRAPTATVVGALPEETVVMSSLTVNLHLLMVSFYRPTPSRARLVVEDNAFPSDSYAVRSQAEFHGYDPDSSVIRLRARPGESSLRSEDVVTFLETEGDRVALVLMGAVNYLTGELLDIEAITRAGRAAGAVVGWDLAHAAGNVPLRLHDWGVDWAAWCSYKYLNGGPGAVAGAFVHERHLGNASLPRFSGWWGTDPSTRFDMEPVLDPVSTADAWQVSNPPILAMAPVLSSLQLFDQVGMEKLRAKSIRLTAYLESVLDWVCLDRPLRLLTPRQPRERGAQLSLGVSGVAATKVGEAMRREHGVIVDTRRPDVLRLAPAPLYCTFVDCWRAGAALAAVVDQATGVGRG